MVLSEGMGVLTFYLVVDKHLCNVAVGRLSARIEGTGRCESCMSYTCVEELCKKQASQYGC